MKWVGVDDVQAWHKRSRNLSDLGAPLGHTPVDPAYVENVLGVPFHLDVVLRHLREKEQLRDQSLDSISFYSLCRGLFIPLAGMTPEKAAQIFGLKIKAVANREEREVLLKRFMERDLGLDNLQKMACLLGDPFLGKPSRFRRASLLRLLMSLEMVTRRELLERLTRVGEEAILFARSRPKLAGDPPLTAAEVLLALRFMPEERRTAQFQLLRSILERCGRVEAYFLVRLVLKKAGLRYEGELLAELIAGHFGVTPEEVTHAMALTDAFEVVHLLDRDGPEGLRKIELQPLVPVRPALAGGVVDNIRKYPIWVERKYDGIRLMLHKTTDAVGSVLAGAYSRNRRDYLELLTGLDATIKMLPGRSFIIDGELHGTVFDHHSVRPATVYEVFRSLQGEARRPVQLRYAAFDLIYLNGEDLTSRPLSERRQRLTMLLGGLGAFPLPIQVSVGEGQMAASKQDLNRLYQHFRNQGYEGIIAKDLSSPYRLAARDSSWLKRKPEVTLDLVLLAALLAITTKEKTGMFGSYVLGARSPEGGFDDVGDVAGVDQARDLEIQQLIMSEGLLTGQRIERAGMTGVHTGFELVPHIVVTIRFAGVVRDPASGKLSLRDPKLVVIRADKAPNEANSAKDIEETYLREKMG